MTDLEVIVIDPDLPDDRGAVLEEYSHKIRHADQQHAGARLSLGRRMAFLDSDDGFRNFPQISLAI